MTGSDKQKSCKACSYGTPLYRWTTSAFLANISATPDNLAKPEHTDKVVYITDPNGTPLKV